MSKHAKHSENGSRFLKPATVVLTIVAAVFAITILAVSTGLLDRVAQVFSTVETTTTRPFTTFQSTTSSTTQTPPPAEPDAEYRFPEQMKGVWLTPGTDYFTGKNDTAETVKSQIDTAFKTIDEWQFNTLLLPMHDDTTALYTSEYFDSKTWTLKDGTAFEPLAYILSLARERNLYVYGIINMHVRDEELWDPRKEEGMTKCVTALKEQVTRYGFDGYFLSGFTFSGKQVPEGEERTAEVALNTMMLKAVETIREANRNLYVGLLSTGVWAHKSVDGRGSDTAEYYEELTDGRADTLAWVQQGLFNCVMVQNYASTNHPTASFQNQLTWWGDVAKTEGVPLYISHSANTIGSYKVGWKLTDQLAQQYLYCKAESAWCGSAYDSLTSLRKDKTGIAETLKKAYDGTLNEDFIYKTLTFTSLSKTKFTTTNSTVKFEGGGDTNFPLYMNGKQVKLTEHGFFTETYALSIGVNTITFTHKGVTKTFTITYKQTLIESVSPSENMAVDAKKTFVISAVGRIGSTLKATLGSQTVTLTPVTNKDDESGAETTDFQTYSGSLTLPNGVVGATKSLGAVSVTATYNGLTETKTGGKVTLNALEAPITSTTKPSGTIPMPDGNGNYDIVVITADYAETFNGDTTDDYSRPMNSYLPRGTWDYLTDKVYNGNFSYYLLASGKRVYMRDAKVIKGSGLKNQQLTGGTVSLTDSHTVLTFQSEWRIPVYLHTAEQNYYRDKPDDPHYGIEHYGQTADTVYLTFYYLESVPKAPDMTGNPLFSSAKWQSKGNGCYVLELKLRKAGAYYGFSPLWNDDGTLTVSFLNPVDISKNSASEKLKGIRILLDPGHGSPTDKPWEAPFNMDYANTLKEKLESLGATVVLTRTGPLTTDLTLAQRTQMAHNNGYHMFISVHMNGANGKATGATVWYYYESAYTASKYIYDEMHKTEVQYGVGTSANGTPRASGTNWGTLYLNRTIHDCPAVLLECAFLDNPKDKEHLIDPLYRDKLMQAVTNGVVSYFAAQSQ